MPYVPSTFLPSLIFDLEDLFPGMFSADLPDVIECQSEEIKEMSVGQFFEIFKKAGDRSKKIYKLKVSSMAAE